MLRFTTNQSAEFSHSLRSLQTSGLNQTGPYMSGWFDSAFLQKAADTTSCFA